PIAGGEAAGPSAAGGEAAGPSAAGTETTDPSTTDRKEEAMADEENPAVPAAETNGAPAEPKGAGVEVLTTTVPEKAAPTSAAPAKPKADQTEQAAPSDGVAGVSALRGLIVYGGV